MADVHLTLAITCLFDPKNAEWKAEMSPVLHALGDDDLAESQRFQSSDYLAASLPEVFSAMETIGVRIQRGVEETHERLQRGEELRPVGDPTVDDRHERTASVREHLIEFAMKHGMTPRERAERWADGIATDLFNYGGEADVAPEGD